MAPTSSPYLDLSGWRSRIRHLLTCVKMSPLQQDTSQEIRLMEMPLFEPEDFKKVLYLNTTLKAWSVVVGLQGSKI